MEPAASRCQPRRMIKVLVVDDHPAVSAGLEVVLRSEPGLIPIGSCASFGTGLETALRERPTVVIVDYELGDGNGLDLCAELALHGVRTLLYSAYSERALTVGALL